MDKSTLKLQPGLASWRAALSFISKDNKRKLLRYAILQSITGVLDLVGIGLIGVIGSISLHGVTSASELNPSVEKFLTIIGLNSLSLTLQVGILASVAGLALICRSLFAYFVSARIFHFLGNEGAKLSEVLARKILDKDISKIENLTRQEIAFILTSGTNKAALDVAGSLILIVADIVSLLLIAFTLIVLDLVTAVITISLFSLLAYSLFSHLKNKASRLGKQNSKLYIEINDSIFSTLDNIRFIKSSNLVSSRLIEFNNLRFKQSKALADLSVMPYLSKYIFEVALVLGALIIAATQFLLHDAIHAITTLTIFLAAGGRLAPAALRLQQSSLLVRANIAYTKPVLDLYKEPSTLRLIARHVPENEIFIPEIKISKVSFKYPGSDKLAIEEVTLEFKPGTFTAVVGTSGAGKSTLIDLLLGLNSPDIGEVTIAGTDPLSAFKAWPGKISYVPQKTALVAGTIAENVAYGRAYSSDSEIWEALELANFSEQVKTMKLGIHTPIGEFGSKLSAGQQQRIGIARSLFSKPKLLLMDEATSALDASTEHDLTQSFNKLKGSVTLVVVAHRLSTVRNADKVIYVSNGKITAQGTMEEVRRLIPDFNTQAKLLGLE